MVVKRVLAALAATLPWCLTAAADEVVLRNGAAFSGIVREAGDKVVIEVDIGTMTFRKSEVRSITKSSDPLKEYEQKFQTVRDAKDFYELAVWAREKGLASKSNELFRKVLSLDAGHEGARRALGYEKVEGKWLDGDELMMAKGFLKHNGRWLPKDTVERIQEGEKQVSIETDRRATETRIAELQQAVEMAKVKLERERLERERLERERMESDFWRWGTWGSPYSRTVYTIPPPVNPGTQPPPVIIQQGGAPPVIPPPVPPPGRR